MRMRNLQEQKCFRKAGILRHDFSVVSPLVAASDTFSDIDDCELEERDDDGWEELTELIQRIQGQRKCL